MAQKTSKKKSALFEWVQSLVTAAILALIIITFVVQSFVVDGRSMNNTLYHGERLFVEKVSYRFTEPARGDIVVLKMPGEKFVKRIIAIGGDTIEERAGITYVNGEPLAEPYVTNKTYMNWGPVSVPEGHYFVMGDNRPFSNDSRYGVGFLPKEDIVGRAIARYWPLSRMGLVD